jgi:hypothetical protein
MWWFLACDDEQFESAGACTQEELEKANTVMIAVAHAYSADHVDGCKVDTDCEPLYYPTLIDTCTAYPVLASQKNGFEQLWYNAMEVIPCSNELDSYWGGGFCTASIPIPYCNNGECKIY